MKTREECRCQAKAINIFKATVWIGLDTGKWGLICVSVQAGEGGGSFPSSTLPDVKETMDKLGIVSVHRQCTV